MLVFTPTKSTQKPEKLSKSKQKALVAEGMKEKARVYIGRNGITERIHRLIDSAWSGTCVRPYPVDLLRVTIQDGCPMTDGQVIDEIERRHPVECVGSRLNNMIFRKKSI